MQDIDSEVSSLHVKLASVYSTRFPELSTLVPDQNLYFATVRELRNEIDNTKYNPNLPEFLPNSLIMVISLSAISTKGTALDADQLARMDRIFTVHERLLGLKSTLENYVESRMASITPNLTALLGSKIATRLLTATGGLKNLVNIPTCNIHMIGAEKHLTTAGAISHAKTNGIIYESDIVLNTNPVLLSN